MQQSLGLPVRWLTAAEVDDINPTMAHGVTLGASYCDEDGFITPPRNVAAYTAALALAGVTVAERTRFTGLSADGRAVSTSAGSVEAGLVVLAGGPRLAEVGALAGISVPAGGVQHQVFVTEQHPAFADTPMAFDVPSGLYWRPEEGGLLFGMSDPDEPPSENRAIDYDYLALMRTRLASLVPLTAGLGIRRAWAATIDFTPDHLPIIGAAPGFSSVFVAAAGGAGMMWGPAVARVAADLALTAATDLVDTADLGLDRFDASGHSRLAADPIALPFPEKLASPPARQASAEKASRA